MAKIIKLKKKYKKKKNKNVNMTNSNEIHININTKPATRRPRNIKKEPHLTNSVFGNTPIQSKIVTIYPSETRELVEDIIRANPSRFNRLPLQNLRRPIDNNTTFGYDQNDGIDVPTQYNSFARTLDQSLFKDSSESLDSLETQSPQKQGFVTEENAPYLDYQEHRKFLKESQQASFNRKQEKVRIAKQKALEKDERYRRSQEKANK